MIPRDLKDISEETLRELVASGATEGKTLEFKRQYNVNEPEGKLKFLRGIASFANASGGDFIFGIAATDGKADSVVPLPNFNPDGDVLRLRDIIRMNIEPRSIVVGFQPVPLSTGGFALVIRVQKTWAGAHLVTFKDDFRFFSRDHAGKRMMDVSEIRDAFTLSESVIEKVNRFRLERIGNIVANETPEPLMDGGRIVLHLLPLSSFTPGKRCDLTAIQGDGLVRFRPMNAQGWDSRHDVEGFYVFQRLGREGAATNYTLASHSGWIEAVDAYWLRGDRTNLPVESRKIIPTGATERDLPRELASYFEILKSIGADAPVVVMLSLVGVRDYVVYFNPMFPNFSVRKINRDQILPPSVLVNTLEVSFNDRSQVNAVDILRPMFDIVWNACGLPKSQNFDASGNWKPE